MCPSLCCQVFQLTFRVHGWSQYSCVNPKTKTTKTKDAKFQYKTPQAMPNKLSKEEFPVLQPGLETGMLIFNPTNVSVLYSEDDLNFLRSMFPHLGFEVVSKALTSCPGNVSDAVESLLFSSEEQGKKIKGTKPFHQKGPGKKEKKQSGTNPVSQIPVVLIDQSEYAYQGLIQSKCKLTI